MQSIDGIPWYVLFIIFIVGIGMTIIGNAQLKSEWEKKQSTKGILQEFIEWNRLHPFSIVSGFRLFIAGITLLLATITITLIKVLS